MTVLNTEPANKGLMTDVSNWAGQRWSRQYAALPFTGNSYANASGQTFQDWWERNILKNSFINPEGSTIAKSNAYSNADGDFMSWWDEHVNRNYLFNPIGAIPATALKLTNEGKLDEPDQWFVNANPLPQMVQAGDQAQREAAKQKIKQDYQNALQDNYDKAIHYKVQAEADAAANEAELKRIKTAAEVQGFKIKASNAGVIVDDVVDKKILGMPPIVLYGGLGLAGVIVMYLIVKK